MSQHPIGAFIIIDKDLDMRLNAASQTGIPTAQILAPKHENRTDADIKELKNKFARAGVTITCVFCGFDGESYADIATVEETVGLVPLEERYPRLDEAKDISDFAKKMGVDVVALHLGFIPKQQSDPGYEAIVQVTRDLCDHCAKNGQRLHLETGQEKADTLLDFIKNVNKENLAVNFDPANMILYGAGEPIPAVKLLSSHIKSVHCKDAKWAVNPGKEWGQEVLLGDGDINLELFLKTLKEIGYVGPLTIEREISGEQQINDIKISVTRLQELRRKIWNE